MKEIKLKEFTVQQTIRILGIDPGLRHMGWGIIDFDGVRLSHIANGTIHSNTKQALAARLQSLFYGLTEVVQRFEPMEAAVELTFVNKDAKSTLKLGQARGIAMLVPALSGLEIGEYAPNLVKKTVTGSGHAAKPQIHGMLKHLLPKAQPESDDAADALAIAITHAYNRRQQQMLKQLDQQLVQC